MMSTYRSILFLVLSFLTSQIVSAQVRLPALFSDNMVVQYDMKFPVWGWAEPGEKVVVEIGGSKEEATADPQGKWKVRVDPVPAGGPYQMTITGQNTITINNVLAGEVWIASGQSNMAMEVRSCNNAQEEISSATYPEIRQFQVKRTKAASVLEDVAGVSNPKNSWLNTWEICDPSTVGHFSGTAYYFARNIHTNRNIPVGIIHTSWGGTTAEAWTPADALENDPGLSDILRDWPAYNNDEEWLAQEYEKFRLELEKARAEGKPEPLYFNQPSVLYNGIIAPVVPFGIRGVIWYQGESNAYRAYQYRDLFPSMINAWRKKWGQGSFPFIFVQLANYHFEPQVFPELREAQSMALQLPGTAMAVAIDIGDSADIHPRNKQEVGRRLALAAQKTTYHEKIESSGPVYKKMFIDGKKCWLLFEHVADGLLARDDGSLKGFTISGDDRVFVEARAIIDGDQVVVWNDKIERPVAVRYAWANHPVGCNFFNRLGNEIHLPASPFRTDDWPGITSTIPYQSDHTSQILPVVSQTYNDSIKKVLAGEAKRELQSIQLYSGRIDIVNGTKWTYEKIYKGNPFIAESYWPLADLTYRGKHYPGLQLNFDLHKDVMILLYDDHHEKKYIVLAKEYLDSFSYTDTSTSRTYNYTYFRLPGTKQKQLYEKAHDGKASLLIRPRCIITGDPSGSFAGTYLRSYDYYIKVRDNYERVQSKKTLLATLGTGIPEMKRFIRRNRLKINNKQPDNIISVLEYFDKL